MSTNSTTPPAATSLAQWVADFRYELPDELIAQTPLPNRSDSRLYVLNGPPASAGARATGPHRMIRDLPALLAPGDRLVVNDTRVVPARLFGRKPSGGRIEFMLERFEPDGTALARLRASKTPKAGSTLLLEGACEGGDAELAVTVTGRDGELFRLDSDPPDALARFLDAHGEVPLPPYIHRRPNALDTERYQTVYARAPGAVAAPTAGLHLDEALLAALAERGVALSRITLHVGAGTFQPVRVDDPSRHRMHRERLVVDAATVAEIEATRAAGGRIVAVGTTSVRALESAAVSGTLAPLDGETELFLRPGSRFNVVDVMLTNFHLPESTLLMLVAAFAGTEETLAAYREAVAERYRFFSYGDAMFAFPPRAAHGGAGRA